MIGLVQRRSSKRDVTQNALSVAETSTGAPLKPKQKNPAAVALGKLGGAKGGRARVARLPPEAERL